MNILFVLNMDFGLPGPSVHLLNDVMEELLNRGDSITVVSKDFGKASEKCPIELKKYERFTIRTIPIASERLNWVKRYMIDAQYAELCSREYRNEQYDCVFLQSCNSACFHVHYIRKYLKARIVFNVQDIFPHNVYYSDQLPAKWITFPIFSWLQRCAYERVDEIITISADMAELLKKAGVGKTRVKVIHNWGYNSDCQLISDEKNLFIQQNMVEGDALRVVYAGNIGRVQNVEIIIQAAKKCIGKNIRFYIIGGGANENAIHKYAEENKLDNVEFFPSQPEKMAPYLYAMADVNLIPLAKGVIETALPSKTAACFTYGRRVIGCFEKNTELGRLLSETQGCAVVNNDSADELAEKLIEIEREQRRQFFGNRQRAMKLFSKEENVKAYADNLEGQ